eukprot:Opistho-2@57704
MGKKTKVGKGRRDKFYKLAKEAGYRSRAAFKLIQLNRKFNFLSTSRVLVDLCAAPGGWLQVASKYMPVSSVIIGVDLVPIKPIRNVITLCEDITTEKCRQSIRKEIKTWKADCVLHDGAPNVGLTWTADAYSQASLALMSLKLACELLNKDGWFITKVFRSRDYHSLMWVLNQLFKKVHATKPQASRNESAEIFVVCQGYLAPDKIDPKLLDARSVFSEVETPVRRIDPLHPEKAKKAKADGYADDERVLYHEASAAAFVSTEDPIKILSEVNKITFDDEESRIHLNHPLTTPEIVECCRDLRVLGKREVKNLLKWRTSMHDLMARLRKELGDDGSAAGSGKDDDDASSDVSEEDEDERIEREAREIKEEAEARKRREKKKAQKDRAKIRERLNLKMDIPNDVHEAVADETLFSLTSVTNNRALKRLADGAGEEAAARLNEPEEEDDADDESNSEGDEYDSDESTADAAEMDRALEEMYQDYKSRKNTRLEAQRAGKKAVAEDIGSDSDDDDNAREKGDGKYVPNLTRDVMDVEEVDGLTDDDSFASSSEEEEGAGDEDPENARGRHRVTARDTTGPNKLVVGAPDPKAAATKRAAMWFSQEMFADADEDIAADLKRAKASVDKKKKVPVTNGSATSTATAANGGAKRKRDGLDDGNAEAETSKKQKKKAASVLERPAKVEKRKRSILPSADEDDGYFEVVPMDKSDESEAGGDSDASEDGENAKKRHKLDPEALAIGAMMLSKKKKAELIDDAYNRYAYNDTRDLPDWFVEDEKKHIKPNVPVTKEMVAEYKARLRELDARPIKKVAEAKARKKFKASKKMERVKQQAEAISESSDLTGAQKARQIEKLYAKNAKTKRPELKVVVGRKNKTLASSGGRPQGVQGRYKMVDSRGKKELRALQRRTKAKGGRAAKKGGKAGGKSKKEKKESKRR